MSKAKKTLCPICGNEMEHSIYYTTEQIDMNGYPDTIENDRWECCGITIIEEAGALYVTMPLSRLKALLKNK